MKVFLNILPKPRMFSTIIRLNRLYQAVLAGHIPPFYVKHIFTNNNIQVIVITMNKQSTGRCRSWHMTNTFRIWRLMSALYVKSYFAYVSNEHFGLTLFDKLFLHPYNISLCIIIYMFFFQRIPDILLFCNDCNAWTLGAKVTISSAYDY